MPADAQRHGTGAARAERPTLEVAEIFRRYWADYVREHRVTPQQGKVSRAIRRCRTAELGGHVDVCLSCGHTLTPSYNSCRNRHCPKCQWSLQQKWIESRLQRMLDTHYFHVVFTLPEELRPLAMTNPRPIYNLLFQAASRTLRDLGRDPKHLGAELGVTMVLHTWTRDLRLHPHIHAIVTGGGLSLDGQRWVSAGPKCLFPRKVIKAVFRGKFLDGLDRLIGRDELELRGPAADFAHRVYYQDVKDRLHRKDWCVFEEPNLAGPERVIKYLGGYTHRIAISNYRLISITDEAIHFRTRGTKTTRLSPRQFIGRFLLHVLPDGFVKIRHTGLLAARNVQTKLAVAAKLLRPNTEELHARTTTTEPPSPRCPRCGSTEIVRTTFTYNEPVPSAYLPRGPPAPTDLLFADAR